MKFTAGKLVPCDPSGEVLMEPQADHMGVVPVNNQMVIYELPAAWTRKPRGGGIERGVGTFRDVLAIVERGSQGANFSDLSVTAPGNAYLVELGINAVE